MAERLEPLKPMTPPVKSNLSPQDILFLLGEQPALTMILNSKLELQYANEAFYAATSTKPGELKGKEWLVKLPIFQNRKAAAAWMADFREGKSFEHILNISVPEKSIYFLISVKRVEHGGDLFAVVSGWDVSRSQKELKESRNFQKQFYRELQMAKHIQSHLNHSVQEAVRGKNTVFRFERAFLPSKFLSGDVMNVSQINERYFSFFIGDGRGHGLPAALYSALIYSYLKVIAVEVQNGVTDLADILRTINTLATRDFLKGNDYYFFSGIFGLIDTVEDKLQMVNAGHPAGLRLGETMTPVDNTGPIIGIRENATYESMKMDAKAGEIFVFYTDGLIDIENSQKQHFGEDRTRKFLRYLHDHNQTSDRIASRLLEHALEYSEGVVINDDISILVIHVDRRE